MSRTATTPSQRGGSLHFPREDNRALLRQLLVLSTPVLVENMLHMLVGWNDTYLANHLYWYVNALPPQRRAAAALEMAAAAAAVGTIAYIIWFTGLIVGAIGTGSSAIIARAVGARHRSLANRVCGQSISVSILIGVVLGAVMWFAARPIAAVTGLHGQAQTFAFAYLRVLAVSLPFSTLMFMANACLRGAGDTLTPAIVMIVVDIVNMVFTFALTYGWAPVGVRRMGFNGIAAGTVIAYIAGGVIQFIVLVRGRGGIRLHLHRMRPHWLTIKRISRIGLPSGAEMLIAWLANFSVVIVINSLDPTNNMAAAHVNAVRIEALSYLAGFAVATAAATMVGQSLGMREGVPNRDESRLGSPGPDRATRSAYLAYLVGGGMMTACGLLFIFFGEWPARWMSANDTIAQLTARCLFITGFIQCGFAASAIFSGALRGAGDTFAVMILNLISVIVVRLIGVLIVGAWLKMGLGAIWVVLAGELFLRGVLAYGRFLQGRWRHVEV